MFDISHMKRVARKGRGTGRRPGLPPRSHTQEQGRGEVEMHLQEQIDAATGERKIIRVAGNPTEQE